jgi:hypothetical protein
VALEALQGVLDNSNNQHHHLMVQIHLDNQLPAFLETPLVAAEHSEILLLHRLEQALVVLVDLDNPIRLEGLRLQHPLEELLRSAVQSAVLPLHQHLAHPLLHPLHPLLLPFLLVLVPQHHHLEIQPLVSALHPLSLVLE